MSKFIIKESSIREESNTRYLKLIQDEIKKHIPSVQFELPMKNGNYSICESSEYTENDFDINYSSPNRLKDFINNTLNFRFENFTITML
jgi:hypothetical protein